MNTNTRIFIAAFCAQWLIGCATNFQLPPLSANNPASLQAKEALTPAAEPMLGRDAITEKTNELLAASAPGNPSFQSPEMQQMHHDMKGMEHGDSGAMKMNSANEKAISAKSYYTCAIHPQIHQDKPGKCPICGMTLVKKEEGPK